MDWWPEGRVSFMLVKLFSFDHLENSKKLNEMSSLSDDITMYDVKKMYALGKAKNVPWRKCDIPHCNHVAQIVATSIRNNKKATVPDWDSLVGSFQTFRVSAMVSLASALVQAFQFERAPGGPLALCIEGYLVIDACHSLFSKSKSSLVRINGSYVLDMGSSPGQHFTSQQSQQTPTEVMVNDLQNSCTPIWRTLIITRCIFKGEKK